jgi:hypothetical protein
MKKPLITVLFDLTSSDGYVSRVRLFFDNDQSAQTEYDIQSAQGNVPTKRPFHTSDEPWLDRHVCEH